jgi:hypothetical protein
MLKTCHLDDMTTKVPPPVKQAIAKTLQEPSPVLVAS